MNIFTIFVLNLNKMITIKDIAKIANVSVGTVDRVIHNREGVSEKTRERVQGILKEHDFKINMIARSLAMKKKYNLAVLMPEYDADNLFWKSPLMGVAKAADEVLSFGVEVNNFRFNQLHKTSYLKEFKQLIEGNPDAVIFTPLFLDETRKMIKILDDKKIPYLFLNVDIEGFNNISFVGQDSFKGGYLAGKLMRLSTGENATYLIAHTKSKYQNNSVIENRIIGFTTYFKDYSIPFESVSLNFGDLDDEEMIKSQLSEVLNNNKNIKGILVPSSRISTISNCINSEKLKELSLIGFDTTEQNVASLEKDEITFLISQKSFNQGLKSVKIMTEYLIQNKVPQSKVYSPIEIITKENLEFSQLNKWQYKNENG